MPRPEYRIIASATSLEQFGHLKETLADEADAIAEAFLEAVDHLGDEEEMSPAVVERYGSYGDTFLYNFHRDYAFVFRKETQRDEGKQPRLVIVYVEALLRRR